MDRNRATVQNAGREAPITCPYPVPSPMRERKSVSFTFHRWCSQFFIFWKILNWKLTFPPGLVPSQDKILGQPDAGPLIAGFTHTGWIL